MFRPRSFPRTDGVKEWHKELKPPFLGNLASHLKDKHSEALARLAEASAAADKVDDPDLNTHDSQGSKSTHGFNLANSKIMQDFLKDGSLNPKKDPTQRGFLRLFAA